VNQENIGHLIMTLRPGDYIIIGGATLTYEKFKTANQVQIGIRASKDIRIEVARGKRGVLKQAKG
jgi:sRNA-binding carbon storage regulator CsrA